MSSSSGSDVISNMAFINKFYSHFFKDDSDSGKMRRAPKLAEFSYVTVSLRANGAAIAAVLVSKTTTKSFAEKIPVATLP